MLCFTQSLLLFQGVMDYIRLLVIVGCYSTSLGLHAIVEVTSSGRR